MMRLFRVLGIRELKLIVESWFQTIPSMASALMVGGIILLIGAMVCMQLYRGQVEYCRTGISRLDNIFSLSKAVTSH
jgi:hypothetical protein